MSLKERLQQDLKEALRNRDDVRRNTIRLLLTAIKNAEIEHGSELNDEQIVQLLQKQAKQRRDSIEQYRQGGRDDLVAEALVQKVVRELLAERSAS